MRLRDHVTAAARTASAREVTSQAWVRMGARLVMHGGGGGSEIGVARLRSRRYRAAGAVGAAYERTYRRTPRKAMESSATVPKAAAARPRR